MAETQSETQLAATVSTNLPVQAEGVPNQQARRSSRRGYYELADRMALAENELAIFRNFKQLNILSLLQLQAEILVLQDDLEYIRNTDDNSSEEITIPYARPDRDSDLGVDSITYHRKMFSSCMVEMQRVAKNDPNQCTQYMKMMELRSKLQEYNDLLLQFSNVCKLKGPNEIELMSLKYWTLTRITDRTMPFMKPPESLAYRSYDLDDYVLIQKPNLKTEIIPAVALRCYSQLYKWITGRDLDPLNTPGLFLMKVKDETRSEDGSPTDHFVKSRLIILSNWLAPILSSVLLVGSALILYSIQGTWNKLLAMIPITTIFSLIIKFFTSASRAEIFGAVAGFVAVEVVFVGNVS
ncbi:hypothetical protein QBC34DRAFT_416909 [Podospora aff. communis PSN243]|uniref:DUF6594 domain-containing protein n=1 Tax=Podospora aff. communis PSN243 TaxID=3040156 RepID=A0AAV9G5T5_9PEZI|nr:hypothetical protein QBC34DRAFT_416909 [Podospora aff. communis PSN243]